MAAIRYDMPGGKPEEENIHGEQQFVNLAAKHGFDVRLAHDDTGCHVLATIDDYMLAASRIEEVIGGVDSHTRSLMSVYAGASADSDYIARMAKDMGAALLVENPAPSMSI